MSGMFAVLLVSLTAALCGAQTHPHAVRFRAVLAGCTYQDPSWTVTVPLKKWNGASFDTCPGPNCTFSAPGCSGSLDLSNLNDFNFFQSMNFFNVNVSGTIDLSSLPSALTSLVLDQNAIVGTADLTSLPSGLQVLSAASNSLSGSLNLARLPGSLGTLILKDNSFQGSVDLGKLPASLVALDISGNSLSGTTNLTALPPGLQTLSLSGNGFTATPNLEALPASLTLLHLGSNSYSGTPVLTKLPGALTDLTLSNNHFSGTPDLSAFSPAMRFLYADNNSFTGTASVFVTSALGIVDLTGNSLFAVWVAQSTGNSGALIRTDASTVVENTTQRVAPLRAGVFASTTTKRALRLSASGTAALGSCKASVPSGSFQVFSATKYVADSGVVAAALAPCLPTTFGTPQYFLQPTPMTLLLVTSGAKNVTFTRRGG